MAGDAPGSGGEMTEYYKPEEGEWVEPTRKGHKMACCDCGLVHTMDFRILNGKIQFRAYRDNRATAGIRVAAGWSKKTGYWVANSEGKEASQPKKAATSKTGKARRKA